MKTHTMKVFILCFYYIKEKLLIKEILFNNSFEFHGREIMKKYHSSTLTCTQQDHRDDRYYKGTWQGDAAICAHAAL